MKISSAAIKDVNFEYKYVANGTYFANILPDLSIPFEICEVPITAESFVVILKDDNAIPIMGQPWTHWSIANLKELKIPEDASRKGGNFIQGKNSWNYPGYGGMTPPEAPHRYDLHVYAMNADLPLKEGFSEKELKEAMRGHVISEALVSGMYSN